MTDNTTTSNENIVNAGDDAGGQNTQNAEGQSGNGSENPETATLPVWQAPKDVPEHLLGKDAAETLEKLSKAYKGARDELSRGKEVIPEKADDYIVELPDDIAKAVLKPDDSGKDPLFEKIRLAAHEKKIPASTVQALAEVFYGEVAEMVSQANSDAAADMEFKILGGAEKAKPVKDGVDAWISGLKNQNIIDDNDVTELVGISSYGQGLRVLDKVRDAMVKSGFKVPADLGGDTGGKEGLTESQLKTMQQDPKYWRDKDPAFIAKVSDGFKKLYGDKKAS